MVVWARYLVYALLVASGGLAVLRSRRSGLPLARALSLLGTSLFFTTGRHYRVGTSATATCRLYR